MPSARRTISAFYSFGEWKDSLFGEHHIHGPEGVRFYTRGKAITARWPQEAQDQAAAHAAIRSWASIELPDELARQKEAAWV